MPIRITGMNSGLDTEAIITQLASARSVKVNSLKKAQIKQQWTQDAWKDLNKKIYSFYTDTLSDMQYVGNYSKKNTTVSDTSKASVTTTGTAVNGTQTMSVHSLAKTAYLTGGKLDAKDASVKLSDLGFSGEDAEIDLGNGKSPIKLSGNDSIQDVLDKFKGAGLNANYDTNQKRIYLSAKDAGAAADFNLSGKNGAGAVALSMLGLSSGDDAAVSAISTEAQTFMSKAAAAISDYRQFVANNNAEKTEGQDGYINISGKTDSQLYAAEMVRQEQLSLDKEYENAHAEWQSKKTAYDRWTAWDAAETDEAKAALKAEWKAENGGDEVPDPVKTDDPGAEPVKQTADADAITKAAQAAYARMSQIAEYANKTEEQKQGVSAEERDKLFGLSAGKIDGADAKIKLNGVEYTSKSNNFEINGLSITALEESEKDAYGNYKDFTLTTTNDTSGIKDMIKNFFTKYNELINEMGKLYNADANKDYQPLLSEEKAELSDHEIEEWENKVKESLLRKDNTLSNVMNSMVEAMNKGFEVTRTTSSGTKTQTMFLQDFGIDTLGYFKAAENERNAYHIDGDKDDEVTANNNDTLGYLISTDPDAVSSFFSQLTKGVYSQLSDLMKSTSYSSAYTVYEDKAMRSEYSDYNDRIKSAEDKLNAYLDNWYARFSKMETAMANLNSKQSSLSGLFG